MDPIANMLVQIKNAQRAKHEHVVVPFSRNKFAIANILKSVGYISDVEKRSKKAKKTEHDVLFVALKYEDSLGAISGIKMISKPSRRMYIKANEIKPVRSGYGLAVVSTSKGIMTSMEASKHKLGGEILFEIW